MMSSLLFPKGDLLFVSASTDPDKSVRISGINGFLYARVARIGTLNLVVVNDQCGGLLACRRSGLQGEDGGGSRR